MYDAMHSKAIVYLKKCYALYEKNEYAPLKEDYNRLQFTLTSKARQSLAPALLGQYSHTLQ